MSDSIPSELFVHLLQALSVVQDPRCPRGRLHLLQDVLCICVLSVLCGCQNAEEMQDWGRKEEPWLRTFLSLPHGIPSQDGMKRLAPHRPRGSHNSTTPKGKALWGAKRWRPAMFFIGIDVHKKQSQICILTEQGELRLELRVLTMRADLSDALGSYLPARIVLESSTPSEWVARHLESMGFEVIVADPSFAPMYATRDKKLKTDKRDARALAQAARLGAYKPAHRLSDEQRALRTRVQIRQTLVQTRTKIINQICAVLLAQGLRVGTGAAQHFAQRVQKVQMPQSLQELIEPLLSMLTLLQERIEKLDEELAQRAKNDEQSQRLQQIPGVGPIISLMFLAVLDGASRFEGAHQVMSYLGLVPREMSSGEKQMRGHITKAGHRQMRVLMVQAAMGIMRLKKPETARLHEWAEKIAQRRGKRIATVALARRLAGVMWAMLRDGTEYQPEPAKPARPRCISKAPTGVQASPSLAA